MKSKKCRDCSEVKTIDNFYKSGHKTKSGVDIMDNLCKDCKRIYKIKRRKKRRDWLNEIKSKLKCNICGYSKATHPNFSINALQFHHTQDNKNFCIADGGAKGYSKETITKEINKCVCLCSRCHAEIHSK